MTIRRGIIGLLFILAILATALQCVIDSSIENVASVCVVLGSALLMLLYVSWSDALETQPVSTFAIIGFCLTTQLGALLAQTVFWTPLRSSLYDPLYTFLSLAFYQGVAIGVHITYRLFSRADGVHVGLFRSALTYFGLYRTPSVGVLWFMGFIGLISYYISSFEGPLGKAGDSFNFLALAPFLIPIYRSRTGVGYCNLRIQIPCLAVQITALSLIALGLNVRVIMFVGVTTVALNYFLIGLRSNQIIRWPAVARTAVIFAVVVALSFPLSYLTTAMAIAHAARGKVPPSAMIDKTISILRHPNLIAAFRAQERTDSLYSSYDEAYIQNPLVARFVETKFHDNALHFARMLTTPESKERFKEVTENSLWVALPGPTIQLLDLNIKKAKKGSGLAASTGDYLAYLARGIPLGGYKTGSMFAQGLVLFGPLFPFVYASICVVLFYVMDLLTVRSRNDRPFGTALVMMNTWEFFLYGITADGFDHMFILVSRGFIQMVTIYCLLYGFARFLSLDTYSQALRARLQRI